MRKMHNKRVGDPSSEFGMPDGDEKFVQKLQTRFERSNMLWNAFVGFMAEHDVTPYELREMFTRYYEEFLK